MKLRIGLSTIFFALSFALQADDKIQLREEFRAGEMSVARLQFKAEGDLLIAQSDNKDKPQSFSAQGTFVYEEKFLNSGTTEASVAGKSLRYYSSSSLESIFEGRKTVRELREAVRLMVCEVRNGKPFVFSPLSPLTVEEYELVEADATLDGLVLGGFLPLEPVAVGATWKPTESAVSAIFNITHVFKNELMAELKSVDEATAKISLTGHVAGLSSGTECERTVSGEITFDRRRSLITQVTLAHREERKPGPLGLALQAKATFSFNRDFDTPIARFHEKELENVPVTANPATELLAYSQPDGRYRIHFQRGWFVARSNPQAAVLRLLDDGIFVSECHILAAPTVAAGTHIQPEEFRTQVQQALGKQFQQFIQEGEVPAPQGHWFYRLTAAGTANEQPVVWIYHLAAGPQGHQLVFIFRVSADQIDQFGARDLALVGALEFEAARTASSKK